MTQNFVTEHNQGSVWFVQDNQSWIVSVKNEMAKLETRIKDRLKESRLHVEYNKKNKRRKLKHVQNAIYIKEIHVSSPNKREEQEKDSCLDWSKTAKWSKKIHLRTF